MNFKRQITSILFAISGAILITTIQASALGPKTVKGQIFDNDNNPLSGVTVLLSLDGRNIGGVVTDMDGRFVLQFESGENDICSLNILSKNYRGVFSEVEIYEDTVYVEYNLQEKPLGLI